MEMRLPVGVHRFANQLRCGRIWYHSDHWLGKRSAGRQRQPMKPHRTLGVRACLILCALNLQAQFVHQTRSERMVGHTCFYRPIQEFGCDGGLHKRLQQAARTTSAYFWSCSQRYFVYRQPEAASGSLITVDRMISTTSDWLSDLCTPLISNNSSPGPSN